MDDRGRGKQKNMLRKLTNKKKNCQEHVNEEENADNKKKTLFLLVKVLLEFPRPQRDIENV